MAREHPCKKNDHISKIAKQYRFLSWKTIWDENTKFHGRRDPNVLYKGGARVVGGDILKIPDLEEKLESSLVDVFNKFVHIMQRLMLCVRILKDDLTPVADAPYELTVPGRDQPYTGRTNNNGEIEHPLVDMGSEKATLTVRVKAKDTAAPGGGGAPAGDAVRGDVPITWELLIGALNPILEKAPDDRCVSGVQQRLNNLRINSGPVDGKLGPNTRAAVKAFQDKYTIKTGKGREGFPDPGQTQDLLYRVHDATGPVPKPPK